LRNIEDSQQSSLPHNRELRRLHQRLSADTIMRANFNRIITRGQTARVDQARQRQALSSGARAAPIFDLLAYFPAVFEQSVFDID
jgi:hypothetical protein